MPQSAAVVGLRGNGIDGVQAPGMVGADGSFCEMVQGDVIDMRWRLIRSTVGAVPAVVWLWV